MNMKYILGVIVLLLILAGAWWLMNMSNDQTAVDETPTVLPVEPDGGIGNGAEPLEEPDAVMERGPETVIGSSVNGTDITAYHFGTGAKEILLVGNLHGGDAPNTEKLAEEFITYFKENPDAVPAGVTVTVIPSLNPDGLANNSRFNANTVDLNRNFACDWAATSMWRNQEVSGGSAAFSEPEAKAVRDYIADHTITAAVVWFAAEGKVYPSACDTTPSTDSVTLAATFATAAGYPSAAEFDAYQINGDMVNWFAQMKIPAISVLLTDRTNTEWSKNEKGIAAVLKAYAE